MIKKQIFLVTTPLRFTYPKDYHGNIVNIGNKDLKYLKNNNLNSPGVIEVNSAWVDKKKLIDDNNYLSNLENSFFHDLTEAYNKTFNLQYSKEYWDIFLRASSFSIMTSLYERWETIEYILKNFKVEKTFFLNEELDNNPNSDFEKMVQKVCNDDVYNQLIYQEILKFVGVEGEKKDLDLNIYKKETKNYFLNFYKLIKKVKLKNFYFLASIIFKVTKNLVLKQKYKTKKFIFLSNSISNKILRIKFNKKFEQQDIDISFKNNKIKSKYNSKLRKNLISNFSFKPNNEFEKFLKDVFFKILPVSLFEEFKLMNCDNTRFNSNFNFKSGLIVVDELYGSNSIYLDWIAKNNMKGAKIVLAQNGGGPITAKYASTNTIKNKIKKKMLVFGNKDDALQKNYGVGNFRFPYINIKPNEKGNILYTLFTPYGYSCNVRSTAPIGGEWTSYMESQFKLIESLDNRIKKKILIRLKKRHSDQDPYKDYFNFSRNLLKKFPLIKHDNYNQSLKNELKNSRLLITTMDTTTFLETLSINFPTILMLDLTKYPVSDDALTFYEDLHKVGIINFNPYETKDRITEIFDDVTSWWNSHKVQKAKNNFCIKYAHYKKNQESDLIDRYSDLVS